MQGTGSKAPHKLVHPVVRKKVGFTLRDESIQWYASPHLQPLNWGLIIVRLERPLIVETELQSTNEWHGWAIGCPAEPSTPFKGDNVRSANLPPFCLQQNPRSLLQDYAYRVDVGRT